MRGAFLIFLAASFLALVSPAVASETDYQRIPAAIHLDTQFSGGLYSPEEVIEIAHSAGVRVAIITDHDTMRFDYGLPLMPYLTGRLGGYFLERPSILKAGARNYLSLVERAAQEYPDLLVLVGVEAIPFFYWQGSLWGGDLTLRRGNEHILVIGLERPEDFEPLPSVGHRTFPASFIPSILSFWPLGLALVGYHLYAVRDRQDRRRRPYRIPALVCLGLAALFLAHNLPFRFPRYDQYHGDQGIRPYQELIDYANSRGALTFWAHPEQEKDELISAGVPILDGLTRIRMLTPSYHEDLLRARRYTGIAVFAEGLRHVLPAGGIWDQVLMDYLEGRRDRPTWGIGEVDFGDEEGSITSTLTYLFVRDLSKASVLDALRQGRFYAVHGGRVQDIALESFAVESQDGRSAVMGEEIEVDAPPRLRFRTVGADTTGRASTEVRVIRSGFEVYRERREGAGVDWTFEDRSLKPGERVYYRMDVDYRNNRIATNPIFVTYKQSFTR